MTTRMQYEEELEKLNRGIVEMSTALTDAIDKTELAVKTQDVKLARELILGDDGFDAQERYLEKYCIDLVVKEAPIASDWRRIASIMRIVGDLERIADHCSDIALYVERLSKEPPAEPPENFGQMMSVMKSMVSDIIPAFMDLNTNLAESVAARDGIVDDLFEESMRELCKKMKRQPESIPAYADYLLIVKYVERMADHAVNVAEWIPYIASGAYCLNTQF